MTSRRPLRFGINCTTTSGEEWLEAARKAEAHGYSTLIAQDHFGAQLGPLPALAAAGAVTTTLRLATLVLDNDFRHPAVLAKDAATVDVLTGGRLELGLGAGWLQSDYLKTGLPYDAPGVRLSRLAEAVQIVKACFTEDQPVTFLGEHYRIENLDPLPHPVQKPRPPIMIGGRQRRALSLAAREADIVGISLLDPRGPGVPSPPTFAQKVAWVREAASERWDNIELHINASVVAIGPNAFDELAQAAARRGVPVSQLGPGVLAPSVEAIVDHLHMQREQFGITYYVIPSRYLETFAPVIARL
jgi:probable F420-dependent oxidoreductase